MSRQLYFECESGISGDMAVAALLDLGASQQHLLQVLQTLAIPESYEVRVTRVKKSGLDVCDFDVVLPKELDPHDHDMDYLFGHQHEESSMMPHHTHHSGRGQQEIAEIFHHSQMSVGALQTADAILDCLADAEAKAHGIPREQVHFHEVGAIDSIIDIAAFAICFDELCHKEMITDVIVRQLTEGTGTVRCQHGVLPVPVPAVTNIASAYGLQLHLTDIAGELITPTGAAIAAVVQTKDRLPDTVTVVATGLGAGKRNYDTAGFLRILMLDDTNDNG